MLKEIVVVSDNEVDFSRFQLDDCELIDVRINDERVVLRFECPVAGWRWKQSLLFLFKRLRLPLHFEVAVDFVDGAVVGGSLAEWRSENGETIELKFGRPVLSDVHLLSTLGNRLCYQFVFDDGDLKIEAKSIQSRVRPAEQPY